MCVCVLWEGRETHTHTRTHTYTAMLVVLKPSVASLHPAPITNHNARGGGLFVLFFFVFCFFFLHCGPNQRFDVPSRFREGVTLDKTTRNGKVSKKSKTNGRERDVGEGGTDTHLYSYLCCVNVCLCVNVCTCV